MAITYNPSTVVKFDNKRAEGELTQILSGATATGFGTNYEAPGYAAVKLIVRASGTVDATLKFWSSSQANTPNFTASVADNNLIALTNVVPTAAPAGADSSSAVASYTLDAEGVYEFEFNCNYAKWFNIEIDTYSSGTISAWMTGANI